MNRSTRLVAAALTASATLLLTACGGSSDDEKDNKKIAGADTGSSKSASPSSSATADGVDRPKIELPVDMKNVFEGRQTRDAVKDAILADNERRISAVDAALASGDLKHSAVAFYATDQALGGLYKYTKNNIDKSVSWTGTARYFKRQVTVFDKNSAAVTYCVDESKTNLKNRKTNKVIKSDTPPNDPDNYVFYNTGLKKNKDGVWQTWSLSEDRGSQECRS
ncbi:hypothetical protein ABZ953_20095 [Streptomyces sp. NPDC046465]|uniref:hypothetical protein n=1 Tax=Streptomyces sp. NPDC046465 TaxID=3155810 RepID=UPI0033FCAFFF